MSGALGRSPLMPLAALEVIEVELSPSPPTALFRIRVEDVNGARSIMKRYADLVQFLDSLQPQTRLPALPRSPAVDDAAVAQDPTYLRLVQAQLDALLARPDVMCGRPFLDFFQLSSEYQLRSSLAPEGLGSLRPPKAQDNLLIAASGYSIPRTWPRDATSSCASFAGPGDLGPGSAAPSAASPAPLAWDTATTTTTVSAPLSWQSVAAAPAPLDWGVPAPPASASSAGGDEPAAFLLPVASPAAVPSPAAASVAGAVGALGPRIVDWRTVECPPPLAGLQQAGTPAGSSPRSGASGASSSPGQAGLTSSAMSSSGAGGSRPWCVICMAKPEEVAVDPCGHLSMCQACAEQVQACPVCRGPIGKLLRVFVVR